MQCLSQQDHQVWRLHPQAQALLLQYPWPGNVRELENVMRRAMVLCTDHHVTPAHLMFDDWLTHAAPAAAVQPQAADAVAPYQPGMPAALETSTSWTQANTAQPPQALYEVPPAIAPTNLQSAVRLNEHQVIMATLASTPSKTEAAKRLGISPRTLRYKMAQLREHGLSMASAF
jgi:two-component system response regulator FlrC